MSKKELFARSFARHLGQALGECIVVVFFIAIVLTVIDERQMAMDALRFIVCLLRREC